MDTLAKPTKQRRIRVVGLRRVERGNLRALADVDFDEGLIVKDFRIIQQGSQQPWISLPSRAWTDQGGERMFSPLVELAPALKHAVIRAILEEWRRLNSNGEETSLQELSENLS